MKQFFKFLLVGALNTAFGYLIYAAGVLAGLPPTLALLIANIAGVCFNFFTTGRLVFANADNSRIWRFVLVYVVVYLLNAGALKVLLSHDASPLLAQFFLLPAVVLFTYFSMKLVVFRERAP